MTEVKIYDNGLPGEWTLCVRHRRPTNPLNDGEIAALELALAQAGLYELEITQIDVPLEDVCHAIRDGRRVADETYRWLQTAAAESASGEAFMEGREADYLANECRADELFNQNDWLCDLAGDHIFDELGRCGYRGYGGTDEQKWDFIDAFNAAVLGIERLHGHCDLKALLKTPREDGLGEDMHGWREVIRTRIIDHMVDTNKED